ncbi:MAG: C25 family cysteine peptidase [Acidobacteriota bacterium]
MDYNLRTKTMRAFRAGLLFVGITLLFAASPSLAGHAVEGAGQQPQQPQFTATISGTITNCANTVPPGLQNVTVALVGPSTNFSPVTNASGFYTQDVAESGLWNITPSKPNLAPGGAGINVGDINRAQQIFLNVGTPPTACQTKAADTNEDLSVNLTDVNAISRFFLSFATGIFNTGQARFIPTSNAVNVLGNVTQNFQAVVLGDVNGGIISGPTPNGSTSKVQSTSTNQPAGGVASTVSLPTTSVGTNVTSFSLLISVTDTTGNNYIGAQGDFTFNETIATVVSASAAGITTTGWTVQGNIQPGPGPTRTFRFFVLSQDGGVTPLAGGGTLIRLNLTKTAGGTPGSSTPLTWAVGLTGFKFLDGNTFELVDPAAQVNGTLTLTTAPSAVALSGFKASGYDDGVYLNWKTGFEAENLGFNIYREVAGKRTLVNRDIVAGSALMTGAATRLEAGQSYGWWDKSPGDQDARYFLEEMDINGLRTMHGPFDVHRAGGRPQRESQAALLSQLGRGEPTTRQVPLNYQPGRVDLRSAEFSAQSAVSSSASTLKLASMPAAKMTIKEEGWYRVTQQELAAAGLDPKAISSHLQLYLRGVEQPILVSGDAIEFFATGQDVVSTDAHVYWLVNGDRPGKRVGVGSGQSSGGGATSFPYTVERRDRTVYFSGLKNGDIENFFGQVVTSNSVDQTVAVSNLDVASGGAAQVEIALQGAIDIEGLIDHQVRVLLNGSDLGRITFDGLAHKVQKFAAGPGLLKDGNNVFTLVGEASNRDISLVDYIRITYQRKFVSDQDVLRVTATGPQTIDGFSSAAIRVFDITDPASVVELAGTVGSSGDKYAVAVEAPGQGARTLLALTDGRIKRPVSITANQPSNLKNKKNKANMVIIARREFFPTLEPLRALRESQGRSVAMVDIEDIFDEFSDGERTPQAVKDFLSFASTTWKKKPGFVLLAGHASLDPKNYLGVGDSDLIPTKLIDTELMETASDDFLGDFNEDGLSELAIGRLPFRTADEAATMVSKIVSYESSIASSEALFVADNNDDFDFEAASSQVRGLMPSGLKASQINRGRVDPDTAKAQLIDAINRGQKLVNYIGHGSVNQWKGNLLTNDDALALTNGGRLPLFVMMTCLNGYFHDVALDSLGESLLKAPHGGAVAVWTSSGMTQPASQQAANREFYRLLFGQKLTLGEAVMRSKAAAQESDVRRTWVLLGDPAMRIK